MTQQAVFFSSVALLCLTVPVSSLLQPEGNDFRSVTDCICPGDVVTYQCTVCGLATAWEGTALDTCSGGEIALTNTDFEPPNDPIVCRGGAIAARGILEENGCLISRLNITFDVTLQGRTVRCSVDNGTHASEVNMSVLALTTEPYPPPEGVYLAAVTSNELVFSWNKTQNCPSLHYNILSADCGNCPNTTDSTSVNCSDFTISNSVTECAFMVQTVICGETLIGNLSYPITVNLTVPTINQVMTVPHYHIDNGLRGLTVTFSTLTPFAIYNGSTVSEGINGSTTSYTINYSDSSTGEVCNSNEINSTSCVGGVCSDEFDVSSSLCTPSSDINVTVSAMTNLGEGPGTNPIKEEYRNNFVRVQVISETAGINCTFLSVLKGTPTSCNATITYGETCQNQELIIGMAESDSVVIVSLRSFLEMTASSKYCGFRVNITASTRRLTVEGNLLTISINNPGDRNAIIAVAVVPVVISIAVIGLIIFGFCLFIYLKGRQKSANITDNIPLLSLKFKFIPVFEECNMIDFAKKNIDNYDPDSGKGYYQFIEETEEYISPKTQIVLVSEDGKQICTGLKAREIIGISDKRESLSLPDLSGTQWKYVFIQSTSRIKTLSEGTYFMFYGKPNDGAGDKEQETSSMTSTDDANDLKLVDEKYYKLKYVPEECAILDIAEAIEGVAYAPGLGYGFYEFTKPEYILYNKQVIVMDQNEKLYYGPGARSIIGIGPGQSYDETEKIEPNFDKERWKRVFIQTRSNVRKLLPDTWFLYCDVASSEMIRILEPSKLFSVPEADEDERQLMKFAKKNIPHYNPRAGYAYYEFTGRRYVIPDRNIIALSKKKKELFTGLGVRKLIGVDKGYDETKDIEAPDLSDTEWECIFIQGKKAYGRVLEPNTRFLYCEYDYNPEVY